MNVPRRFSTNSGIETGNKVKNLFTEHRFYYLYRLTYKIDIITINKEVSEKPMNIRYSDSQMSMDEMGL